MEFFQLDVFARVPYSGNPLAVFPYAEALSGDQMQRIAREMNLSETTFVTSIESNAYSVRIFTPNQELPFAGHPTVGTAWLLSHLNLLPGDSFIQRSAAGETQVRARGESLWFERTGSAALNAQIGERSGDGSLAAALGLDPEDIGLDAGQLGGSGRLLPAVANAGVEQLMVPVRDDSTLGRCLPRAEALKDVHQFGTYCFTSLGGDRLAARGFFPEAGVLEDPATGSAAAGLGLYLGERVGGGTFEIEQGREMGRPSLILMRSEKGKVSIGGRCELIFKGELEVAPA